MIELTFKTGFMVFLIVLLALIMIFRFDANTRVFASEFNQSESANPKSTQIDQEGMEAELAGGCDPQDPSCSNPGNIGSPSCDPQDPSCSNPGNIGLPPCDLQDPDCSIPPCDPQDPQCTSTPCDPQDPACPGGGPLPCDPQDPACPGGGPLPCDPQDPACHFPPCDPLDPQCTSTPCDPQDPACPGGGPPPDNKPPPRCDPRDQSCSGGPLPKRCAISDDVCWRNASFRCEGRPCSGGPFPSAFPGGAASSSADKSITVVGENVLTSFRNNIVPIAEGLTLQRENICDDGQDNNGNGLRDFEDPGCARISDLGTKGSIKSIVDGNGSMNTTNSTSDTLEKDVIDLEANVVSNDNTFFISISGGDNRDIRTISFSQDYGYSPQELTVKKGSKLVWVNQDPAKSHGINIVDKVSGKTIFENPGIRFGESVSYEFQGNGEFTFFDPVYQSMTGRISVLN